MTAGLSDFTNEDNMADLNALAGQLEADPGIAGTTADGPGAGGDGSGAETQTTAPSGPDVSGDESFFDPKSIADNPELMSAYKQMQRQFTKKMQSFADKQQAVEAYDAFMANPVGTMQQLAQQYGYRMVQAAQDAQNGTNTDWNPQNWDDVMAEAERRVLERMKPVYSELRNMKKQSVESYLDREYPDWRTYEDDMVRSLKEHPSLANDPDKLYRLAVPDEVWLARATKAAMAKLKASSDGASVAGQSTTARETTSKPSGPLTFDQAIQHARAALAKRGIRRPAAD